MIRKKMLLRLQLLETRDNPAASMDMSTGIVRVVPDQISEPVADNEAIALDTVPGFVRVYQNGTPYDFPEAAVTSIVVGGNFIDSNVNVERVRASTPVMIYLPQFLGNSVDLSSWAHDLDNIASAVTVDGATEVVLYDQSHIGATEYHVSQNQVTTGIGRTFGGLECFFSTQTLTLNMASAGATANFGVGNLDTTTRLVSSGSDNVFNLNVVDDTAISGPVQVAGAAGSDVINVARGFAFDYHITPFTVDWGGIGGPVNYSSIETLNVNASDDDQVFTIDGLFTGMSVTIDDAGGADRIRTPNTANTWVLTNGADAGFGNVRFVYIEHLEGSSFGDTFRFMDGPTIWPSIDGKGGKDTIDYSLLTAGVTADLAAGTVFRVNTVLGIENVTGTQFPDTLRGDGLENVLTGLGGADVLDGRGGPDTVDGGDANDSLHGGGGNDVVRAGAGNDSVTGGDNDDILYGAAGNDIIDGGNGNDVLFGQAGKDALTGAVGRDILFGGTEADVLDGGAEDDILSSGNFVGDHLISRVQAIRAEWTSTHSYSDRVANLRGDSANSTTYAARRNGNHFLTTLGVYPTVILSTVAEDKLTGGPAKPGDVNQDWFFGLSAEFMDRVAGEQANG